MKFFTRILAVALAMLVSLPAQIAPARPIHGGIASGGGGSALLTTMTIQNTSGSTQATNFVTQIFGHPFVKGQIANGCTTGAPKFELTNGTNVPFSEGAAPICWSDGSLKWAPFMLRVPTTIAGSGSLTINIKSGGTFPSASSRALSDFATGSTDLNVSVDGLDNLSGTWVSNLNQGVSAANTDNYVYMDGDAGKVWRVRASFRQASADHGQLEAHWYVQALNNGSGTLGGIRYLARVTQPWYNISSPTSTYRSFSAFALKNGASTVRDMMSGHYGASFAKTFTWVSGNDQLTSTANGLETSFLVKLTTTGSLPTGLSTSTNYFVGNNGNANIFQLSTSESSAASGQGFITPSTNCTGTCTATPYPYLPMWTSLYTAGTDAKYDYLQAGGSIAADSTTRLTFTNTYWRSTKMIGPYQFGTVSPTNNAASTYYPGTVGPLVRNIGATGERYDIGTFTHWAVTHMYNQDANDEQNVRVIGLAAGGFAITSRSKTTFTIPNVLNASYSGMPASNTTFGNGSGYTVPTDLISVGTIGFTGADPSHLPETTYYALLLTGEPQFNDDLVSWSAAMVNYHPGPGALNPGTAVVNGTTNAICGVSNNGPGTRNCTINGTTYYGMNVGVGNGTRTQAWTDLKNNQAAAIAGGYEPAGAVTRTYLNDIVANNYAGRMDYITNMLPTFAKNNGMWAEADFGDSAHVANWQQGYLTQVSAVSAGMLENTNLTNFTIHLAKWQQFLHDNFGTWVIPFYNGFIRTGNSNTPSGNSNYNPYLTSVNQFAACSTDPSAIIDVSWASSGPTFTLINSPLDGYAPANNDTTIFGPVDGNAHQGLTPGGFTSFTPYFMVNVSGGTFQLSATQGGSAITPTDTQTVQGFCVSPRLHPSSNNISGGGTGSGYMQNITGGMNAAKAAVSTVDATTLTDMNANLQAAPGYSSGIADFGLKYSFGQSY